MLVLLDLATLPVLWVCVQWVAHPARRNLKEAAASANALNEYALDSNAEHFRNLDKVHHPSPCYRFRSDMLHAHREAAHEGQRRVHIEHKRIYRYSNRAPAGPKLRYLIRTLRIQQAEDTVPHRANVLLQAQPPGIVAQSPPPDLTKCEQLDTSLVRVHVGLILVVHRISQPIDCTDVLDRCTADRPGPDAIKNIAV